ncbi:DUF2334 domain-containing protein [Pseudonocardia asaccharolytica]|uniref:DUF2334 domain-containing protein n=1 Tax=Pseudonocardia asaccharolytica DSM 44247 = NBRC 16224 TaxID=1123024 RepID=A0A511D0A3_9PSEU|nr:DUF2334 domain-containing protein [Pseudonocardia asaccharolytica]GEL18229.1 DUF2334 domain-containing protein [Pseudonocardia asaccharolytica DSM 44247 = NBRC 16224]
MTARLVVSLSGLSADTAADRDTALARAIELAAALDARRVPLSQLFRPRVRSGPIDSRSELAGWLRERRAAGDAILLHGYDHTTAPLGSWQPSAMAGLGRRAEFAALPRHEAGLRLTAARRVLVATGLTTDLFVPPRWLVSPGTLEALRDQRFAVCADEHGVRLLDEGAELRSRVLGFRVSDERKPVAEGRKAAELARCRLLEAEALRVARRGGLVRIALRAKDLAKPARVRSALATVDAVLALGARPLTYAPGAALVAA